MTRAGVAIGQTPMTVAAKPGESIDVELSLPGYVGVARSAIAEADRPATIAADLALATGFDGVWTLPGGELRAFERRGEQVAAFKLATPGGHREFLRFFAFVPSERGAVAFTATEPFVVEAAPDEPSCNIPLRAEYVYRPADDSLAVRKERAQYTLADGRCTLHATAWSEPRPLVRAAGARADTTWIESRAGAPAPVAATPGPSVIEPIADKPTPSKPTKPSRKPDRKVPPPDLAPDAVSPGDGNLGNPPLDPPANDNVDEVQTQQAPPAQPPAQLPGAKVPPPARDDDNVQTDGAMHQSGQVPIQKKK